MIHSNSIVNKFLLCSFVSILYKDPQQRIVNGCSLFLVFVFWFVFVLLKSNLSNFVWTCWNLCVEYLFEQYSTELRQADNLASILISSENLSCLFVAFHLYIGPQKYFAFQNLKKRFSWQASWNPERPLDRQSSPALWFQVSRPSKVPRSDPDQSRSQNLEVPVVQFD